MSKKLFLLIIAVSLFLTACSASEGESEQLSSSSSATSSVSSGTSHTESSQDSITSDLSESESTGSDSSENIPATENVDSAESDDITMESYDAADTRGNPGSTVYKGIEYNGISYGGSPMVCRVIMKSDGKLYGSMVIDGKLDDSSVKDDELYGHYVSHFSEFQYIGIGKDFGWGDENTKLYLADDLNIVALYPYDVYLNNDTDKDELLALCSSDMIYGITILETDNGSTEQ